MNIQPQMETIDVEASSEERWENEGGLVSDPIAA